MPLRRWLIGACLGLVAVTGCNCGDDEKPNPTVLGDGTIGSIKPAAHNSAVFTGPMDATPNPDGTSVYFTARNDDGAGIFKASGDTPIVLYAGDLLAAPVGITVSSDDTMVYVADPGAIVGTDDNADDRGVIWMVPTAGGMPTVVPGTAGYMPAGLILVSEGGVDQLYFTGKAASDGTPGVFRVPAVGGTVEGMVKGEPFSDPSGIAISVKGNLYVVDSASRDPNSSSARIIQVVDQTATVFVEDLKIGFPAGIALAQDDSGLLVSALDPLTRTDTVVRVDLATKEQKPNADGIDTFEEAAGLHRAAKAEVYAWSDSSADGTGTVFLLTP
jgi:DNA-binding beta-propeller fold protein YncE